jgi:hypothetical protein
VAALVVLVFAALGPGKLIPRSGLGWEMDHFISYYFAFTWMFCLAWPRPTNVAAVGQLGGIQVVAPSFGVELRLVDVRDAASIRSISRLGAWMKRSAFRTTDSTPPALMNAGVEKGQPMQSSERAANS